MNKEYKEQYDKLVEKVQKERRGIRYLKDHGRYYNIHHIDPRSLGGSDKPYNLIKFTHEEHFEAHRLLYLMYKGTNGRTEYKMAHAFMAMSMNEKFTSRDYSEAKKSMFDIGISDKTRRNMSKPHSMDVKLAMVKGSSNLIPDEDLQKVIDEITERVLNGEGAKGIDIDIAKRYGGEHKVVRRLRLRDGLRYKDFPQTLTKGQFRAAMVNQRRINKGGKPMTKQELEDWAKRVDGKNQKSLIKTSKKPLTKEQIQYRADVRASKKKK